MRHDIPRVAPEALRKYSALYSSLGKDYVFSRLTCTDQISELNSHTMRLGGATMILTLSGSIELNVNMTHYKLTPNTLMLMGPEVVFNVDGVDWDTIDAYVFVISREFIRDIRFEINMMTALAISSNQPPVLNLREDEVALMGRYLDLIHANTIANADPHFVRSISTSLITAAAYQMMQFVANHAMVNASSALTRKTKYIHDFLLIVNENYKQERNIDFYANRMKISPKYLSLIIKESTGRSAAQWIDDFVVLEAKNLLLFSGKNIQQVAAELHFSSQSSFGKYFKHQTGLSPTEFQKSN